MPPPSRPLPRVPLPLPTALVALLAAAFVLPGLTGHDPWKSFDAITIGVVHAMAESGDWLVPRVAGTLWLQDPPLYHWLALVFAKALGRLAEFHAAMRLASGLLVAAALALLWRTARDWADEAQRAEARAAAPLLLIGSIGLIVHVHEALPELAALAAVSGALAALPGAARRPLAMGIGCGAGLGLAALAVPPAVPLAIALAIALAHVACPEWRNQRGAVFLAAAAVTGLLIASLWPIALAMRSPELARAWWAFAAQPQGALSGNLYFFTRTGAWFAWPAWPLALWTAWALRRRLLEPRLFVPACASLLAFCAAAVMGPTQDSNLIACLPPVILLAAQGVRLLRRGAANALDWFGVMTFGFFAALVWLGYLALQTGWPPRIQNNFLKTAPGFVAQFDALALAFALVLALAWIWLVLTAPPGASRGVTRWAAGVVLLWGTFATLWMPWADYQKSYRSVALQLSSKLPVGASCLAQRGLGVPQAAALEYHANLRPRPADPLKPRACPLLLVQGNPRHELDAPGPGWTKLADVGRPGDKSERYRLYRYGK